MKATDLMIGDWVVQAITDGSSFGVVKQMQPQMFTQCDFEPIPLTPKILKKNGFKKVGTYEWQRGINVTRWRLFADDFDSMVEILYAPKYDGFTWKGCDVNHIHKLQHALRLCGLTDLADNFKV